MFANFDRKSVALDDVAINYVIGGSGPPLLMLHGFPQNLAMWAHVAPILAKTNTVICADLRGYGDSGKPRCLPDCSNYSFRRMALDNVALMAREGFERFHVVGHDRGGRTGHRMALDHPDSVISLTVLDIVPTYSMFTETNRHVAGSYWHWYFLSQTEPFPEHMIGLDPDYFYETCLFGWGATKVEDFDPEQLADYRRCWNASEMIHGSCSDYRAAATIDLEHDEMDIHRKVGCSTLVLYGADGAMANCFDIPAAWQKRCNNMQSVAMPGGHFFVDVYPDETTLAISGFIEGQ